jgi:hypothetical protein
MLGELGSRNSARLTMSAVGLGDDVSCRYFHGMFSWHVSWPMFHDRGCSGLPEDRVRLASPSPCIAEPPDSITSSASATFSNDARPYADPDAGLTAA